MNANLDQLLQHARLSYVEPLKRQVSVGWRWWIHELIAVLPEHWQQALADQEQRLFIEPVGNVFVLRSGSADAIQTTELPAEIANSGTHENVLLMPSSKALVRSITLPLATEENLREVLSFEMDRQTPFTVDNVYYDFVVTSRNTERRTLTVDLFVAARKVVDELTQQLSARGIDIDVVTMRQSGGGVLPVNLLSEPRPERRPRGARLRYALAAVAALLLVTAAALPIARKHSEIAALTPQVAQARARVADTLALRREVERFASASERLFAKKQQGVLFLQALEEVSRVLPDDSFATRVDLTERGIMIQGQSVAADTLIRMLEESPLFHDAKFDSSVVRVGNNGSERFQITAEIERPGRAP